MVRSKIVISCAGLGMGNASRIAALIEELHGFDVDVYSWGAGFRFLREFRNIHQLNFRLFELESFSGKSLTKGFITYLKNCWYLRQRLSAEKIDLIIADSDYHLPGYIALSAPRWFIGQAADVIARKKKFRPRLSLRGKINFFLREKLDFFFQYFCYDRIFVPSFSANHKQTGLRVQFIDLIVRKEFLNSPNGSPSEKIGILLSGSKQGLQDFECLKENSVVEFIARGDEKTEISSVAEMDKFHSFICQGGLSSLSELLTRKKPLFVVPLPHHPEQLLNAMEIERLGAGIKVEPQFFKDNDQLSINFELNSLHPSPGFTGASQLVQEICNTLVFDK